MATEVAITVHQTYVTHDTYVFDCPDCGNRWSVKYEARHSQDPDGAELCMWSRGGLPSMSPDAGMPCQVCTSVRATASHQLSPTI